MFKKDLEPYGLNIELEQLFDKVDFWNYVGKHKEEITYINFQFIKPNLADISKSLPEVFRNFADNTNSHERHITIKAPDKGTLENIDKANKNIEGLVDYTSNGAGSIKLKVKNIRKQLNTKENPVILQVKELDIDTYLIALSKDKKNKGSLLGLILNRGYGKVFKDFTENDTKFRNWMEEYFTKELN